MKNKENQLDNLFDKARNQQPETSFDETKGQFLNDVKAGKTGSLSQRIAKSFNFKYLIMLSIVSTIIITAVLVVNNKEVKTTPIEKITINETKIGKNSTFIEEPIVVETIEIIEDKLQVVTSTFFSDTTDSVVVEKEKFDIEAISYPIVTSRSTIKVRKQEEPYRFPKLTPDEIEANNKQKAKMLKQLAKLDVKKYVYIPSGAFMYRGKDFSVQTFYMQNTEVTNLEYRTFLFDLLINGRNEDFLKAKPDQSKWCNIDGVEIPYNEPMKDLYFSHPAYNDYPVNNISREGAEMYCKWLTQETIDSGYKFSKYHIFQDLRLPTEREWVYAAQGSIDGSDFPWGGSYVKSANNNYLANYRPLYDSTDSWGNKAKLSNTKKKKFDKTKEGALDRVYIQEHFDTNKVDKILPKYTYSADGGFHTVRVNSYLPNDYGLYCMSGNVAEMVWRCPEEEKEGGVSDLKYCNPDERIAGTKGGGWNSDLGEIKITGEDKYKGVEEAHSNIGFRVVFSFRHLSSFQPDKIKITVRTTKEELERFKRRAENAGIQMTFKVKYLNNKIKSLTIMMDTDDDPKNCGGIYYKGSFLVRNNQYVIVGWKETDASTPELFMETSE